MNLIIFSGEFSALMVNNMMNGISKLSSIPAWNACIYFMSIPLGKA